MRCHCHGFSLLQRQLKCISPSLPPAVSFPTWMECVLFCVRTDFCVEGSWGVIREQRVSTAM